MSWEATRQSSCHFNKDITSKGTFWTTRYIIIYSIMTKKRSLRVMGFLRLAPNQMSIYVAGIFKLKFPSVTKSQRKQRWELTSLLSITMKKRQKLSLWFFREKIPLCILSWGANILGAGGSGRTGKRRKRLRGSVGLLCLQVNSIFKAKSYSRAARTQVSLAHVSVCAYW